MVYKVFRRPSIDLDAKRKTWEKRIPSYVEVGAIVADYGEVVDTDPEPTLSGNATLIFASGKAIFFNSPVYCYQ
jgi:hypothetical protein